MKEHYTDFEQKMVKYFFDHRDTKITFKEFLVKNMSGVAIELSGEDNCCIVSYHTDVNPENYINGYYTADHKSVMEIIIFLEYLLKNNLIYFFEYNKDKINSDSGTIRIYDPSVYKYSDGESIQGNGEIPVRGLQNLIDITKAGQYMTKGEDNQLWSIFPSRNTIQVYISDFIKKYYSSLIYPSPILIELRERKFKTPEQKRFEDQLADTNKKHTEAMGKAQKQIWWAKLAFVISLLAFITAITIPFFTSTKIDNDSTKEFEKIIKESRITIPEAINTNITNDTLKVDVVKTTPNKR